VAAASRSMEPPMLEVRDLCVSFGGLRAVDAVSIEISPHEVVGIIGPNGAGKSTLVSAIAGSVTPDSGAVLLAGRPITKLPPHRIARAGLTRTYQMATQFSRMTVLENLLVGAPKQRGAQLRWALLGRRYWEQEELRLRAKALELLARFGLAKWRNAYAGSLSGGQLRILEIARALMTDPKMLILDEPTAGLAPLIVTEIEGHVESLPRSGVTVVLVEHRLDFVERLADRVVVMASGRVLRQGALKNLREDADVVGAYIAG